MSSYAPRGIPNFGNTCYLNSVIQILRAVHRDNDIEFADEFSIIGSLVDPFQAPKREDVVTLVRALFPKNAIGQQQNSSDALSEALRADRCTRDPFKISTSTGPESAWRVLVDDHDLSIQRSLDDADIIKLDEYIIVILDRVFDVKYTTSFKDWEAVRFKGDTYDVIGSINWTSGELGARDKKQLLSSGTFTFSRAPTGGHYYTYLKDVSGGWTKINDNTVTKEYKNSALDDILLHARVLLYRRAAPVPMPMPTPPTVTSPDLLKIISEVDGKAIVASVVNHVDKTRLKRDTQQFVEKIRAEYLAGTNKRSFKSDVLLLNKALLVGMALNLPADNVDKATLQEIINNATGMVTGLL